MSSLIIATVPVHGHVTPLLAVARHFVERGDRVRFITGARFAEAVAATGAQHVPLPADADFDDRELLGKFPERETLKGAKVDCIRHRARLHPSGPRPVRRDHDSCTPTSRPTRCSPTRPLLGARSCSATRSALRPPIVVCGVIPLTIASRDTAPYGMGLTPLARSARSAAQQGAQHRRRPHRVPTIGADRQEVNRELHGRPLPFPVLGWPRHAEAIVQFTVPEFEYPRSDAPATLHFAGPISADRLGGVAAALVGRARRLEAGRPRHAGHDREP